MNRLLTPEIIKQRSIDLKIKKAAENAMRKREKIDNILSNCEDKFIKKICELFINRWDCYAIQDNENPLIFPTVYQDLTLDIIKRSLDPNSDITIGIHQINEDKVKWLCYDIDKKHTPHPKLLSDQIIKYIKEWYNLHGYLEPSGSPESYHVWIFIEPTPTDIAINFHKTFKDRLKSIGIDIKPIDKGISRGHKNLGCMIKLPFNIQRKTNIRSELLTDILNIIPQKIPIVQTQTIQESEQAESTYIGNYSAISDMLSRMKSINYNGNANIELCREIISEIPKISNKLKSQIKPDRSKLDYSIIKALAEVNIPKDVIFQYLKTIPISHTKVHDIRKDYYFQMTYDKVIRSLYCHQYRITDQMLEREKEDISSYKDISDPKIIVERQLLKNLQKIETRSKEVFYERYEHERPFISQIYPRRKIGKDL